jgi:hypothetical protein
MNYIQNQAVRMTGSQLAQLCLLLGSVAARTADMIADKTDNVEVVVALDGTAIDDGDDIGNE